MKIKVRVEFLDEKGKPAEVKPWETPCLHLEDPMSLKLLRNAIGSIFDSILRLPAKFPQPTPPDKGHDLADTVA